MNKITAFLIVIIISLSFILGATIQSRAQNKVQTKNLAGVVPFVTSSDRLGFLNQNTGRIYMYDSSYSKCVFVGQISELGQPIEAVK